VLAVFCCAFFGATVAAQTDPVVEARSAIAAGDYPRASSLLSTAIAQRPSADAYVYLAIAYAHTREWKRAEDTLLEGAGRYPQDPRFHNELAGVYLSANDLDRARQSLNRTLAIDPENKYAVDLLATIDMSTGNPKAALTSWNKLGRPVVGEILHNTHLEYENWVVGPSLDFKSGDILRFSQWRTTEARLRATRIFTTVNIDIEPTPQPDNYNAVIRTSVKANTRQQLALPLLEAVVFKRPSIHWWNVRDSGISVGASYRFSTNRHRAEAEVLTPLPLPGLAFLEAEGIFRSERWDISRPARDTGYDSRFRFESTGFRAFVKHIPHYRFEFGYGIEYRNRTVHGSQPGLMLDSRNSGKLLFRGTVLPNDGRYRSRIDVQGFVARKFLPGNLDYSGVTVEWNHRYTFPGRKEVGVEVTLKGGGSRGALPIDDYYVVGLDRSSGNLLRGHHSVSSRGHYGHAPMGTGFVLMNTTVDRRLIRVPFFNVLNLPYLDFKGLVFLDGARTYDRARVFEQGKILVDVGAGFRLETESRSLNLTYGRSLRDGTGTLGAYIQQRW
jgi:tetratricopeptide (TPR) repeat protein